MWPGLILNKYMLMSWCSQHTPDTAWSPSSVLLLTGTASLQVLGAGSVFQHWHRAGARVAAGLWVPPTPSLPCQAQSPQSCSGLSCCSSQLNPPGRWKDPMSSRMIGGFSPLLHKVSKGVWNEEGKCNYFSTTCSELLNFASFLH